ncbi:MAG: hypothetical protein Q8S00_32345 [Deltaproteobacteria bacterium]|nr:hypothetical protein [Deltaproteobacteria bacterium]
MIAAVIAIAGVAAGLTGLAAALTYLWNVANNRTLSSKDSLHNANLLNSRLELQHEGTLHALKVKENECKRLAAALSESDEAYREIVELNIQDPASALRLALSRLERLRNVELPKASEATTTEGGDGDDPVHGQDPNSPSEG